MRVLSSVPAEPQASGWQVADAFLGVTILLGVLIAGNIDRMPEGLDGFLAVRLSVKNIVLLLTLFGLAWPAVLMVCGLYEPVRLREGKGEWPRLIAAGVLAGFVAMIFPLTSRSGAAQPIHAVLFSIITIPAAASIRLGARAIRRLGKTNSVRNVLVVGSGPRACATYRELQRDDATSYNILGFLDDIENGSDAAALMPYLGPLSDLEGILERHVVDEVRITLPVKSCYDAFQWAIGVCERVGIAFSYPLDTFQHSLTRPRLGRAGATSSVSATPIPHDEHLLFKRLFDIVVAVGMLTVLSVPILLIALAVKLTSPGPVLFAQRRFGQNKRPFIMYKFRSMRVDAELALRRNPDLYAEYCANNFKLPEDRDPRITAIGRVLRKSSFDELPQLWNVLRGDMSIVGPRPVVPEEIAQYGAVASLLLALKPGLTSMWVVEGRSEVGYPRRADLELMYVRNWSLVRDLWILARTVPAVFRGQGAH